jgi:hypothetical protein
MLSLPKHLYRGSNPFDWVYYHTRDASTSLSMTFFFVYLLLGKPVGNIYYGLHGHYLWYALPQNL